MGFRSLQENIDTTTATGRLVFHVLAALAEFERDLIRERTQAGLSAARARGRLGGRKPVLTREKAAAAQRMYDSNEMQVSEIARVLGVSRATLYRSLHTNVSPAAAPGTITKRAGPEEGQACRRVTL